MINWVSSKLITSAHQMTRLKNEVKPQTGRNYLENKYKREDSYLDYIKETKIYPEYIKEKTPMTQ